MRFVARSSHIRLKSRARRARRLRRLKGFIDVPGMDFAPGLWQNHARATGQRRSRDGDARPYLDPLSWSPVVKIVLTILACIVIAVAGGIAFVYSGIYDVSALHPDNPLVAWALHTTSDHSVDARLATITEPPGLDNPDVIQSGARFFGEHCVVCHGGPGLQPTDIAQGLNPAPPNLFRPARKNRTVEMFWFIENGVKMTAMPGFGKTQGQDQIWAVASFLHMAPGITPEDFAAKTGLAASKPRS
jgi:mono/diheme cytochrome c family protein